MTVPGQSGGYRVQNEGMDSEAKKLDKAGDDVGDIAKAVKDTLCYLPDVLGGSDSGPAYNNFADNWQDEAKVLEAALHELADKVRTSKASYHGADARTVRALNAADGGGFTTMPAPIGATPHPGYSTRPTPAGDTPDPRYGTRPTPGERHPSLSDFD
ncbi:WXG100 family type VII secretion target [Streptomyces sp. NPDC002851]